MNNNFINNSNDSSINLDKNILVDALKHTSEIMIALSSKVYIIEEEIKNINSNLLSFVKENKQLKEALKKKIMNLSNFMKLIKILLKYMIIKKMIIKKMIIKKTIIKKTIIKKMIKK